MCVCVREMHVMHVRVQTLCATVHVRVQTHNAFSLHSVWEIACDVYVRVHVHVRVRACVCASAAAIFGLVPSRRSAAHVARGGLREPWQLNQRALSGDSCALLI